MRLPEQKGLTMNACPTFPASPDGLVASFIYRIVAFLMLCIRACGLGTTPAKMPETHARIATFAARLLCLARSFARLETRARRETRPLRHAGIGARRMLRATSGERQAGDADSRIAEGGASIAAAGARVWRGIVGRDSNRGQTHGGGADDGRRAAWRRRANVGTICARGETRSKPHNRAQNSLVHGQRRGAPCASCEFSTGFRNWVRALGSR